MATEAGEDVTSLQVTMCATCSRVCRDPRVLPCVHTSCFGCIRTYNDVIRIRRYSSQQNSAENGNTSSDVIACPACRKEFTLGSAKLEELPLNYFVDKLIRIRQVSTLVQSHHVGQLPCDVCTDETSQTGNDVIKAVTLCVDCDEKLCENCSKVHRKQKISRHHRTISLSDCSGEGESVAGVVDRLHAVLPIANCYLHADKRVEIFCLQCRAAICVTCYIKRHNSHACSDIAAIEATLRKEMTSSGLLVVAGADKCRDTTELVVQRRSDFLKHVDRIETEIREHAEKMRQLINIEELRLLNELITAKQVRVNDIDHLLDELEYIRTSMSVYHKYVEQLSVRGTATDIACSAGGLHRLAQHVVSFDVSRSTRSVFDHGDVTFVPSSTLTGNPNKVIGTLVVKAQKLAKNGAGTIQLSHMLPRDKYVGAVTSLDDFIYVIRNNSHDIESYHAVSFLLQRRLAVPRLNGLAYGLAACPRHRRLYVSDCNQSTVHRVSVDNETDDVVRFPVPDGPAGLSVDRKSSNVIVTCNTAAKLVEMTTDGVIVRRIAVPASPWHAVALSSGQYAVSLCCTPGDVIIVDTFGKILNRYTTGNAHGSILTSAKSNGHREWREDDDDDDDEDKSEANGTSTTEDGRQQTTLRCPRTLALYKKKWLIVTDYDNDRIVVIDRQLTTASTMDLPTSDNEQGQPEPLHHPISICVDESRDRLYVGEDAGGRVLVYDHVSCHSNDMTSSVSSSSTTSESSSLASVRGSHWPPNRHHSLPVPSANTNHA